MVRSLEIFVMPDCPGDETARRLAERVRTQAWRHVAVHLVDLSAPGAVRPQAVFAVPTYSLDGRMLCLGNPEESWLLSRLAPTAPVDPED
ncbi:MAG TPA: hypothetical protein VKB09_02185 [Thermomicrobiales bacterium]|nr:hypothetical protein [Thermomicrobiales bacterium]